MSEPTLIDLQEALSILQSAIEQVTSVANKDRKTRHLKHMDSGYREALEHLDKLRTGLQARIKRLETVGAVR